MQTNRTLPNQFLYCMTAGPTLAQQNQKHSHKRIKFCSQRFVWLLCSFAVWVAWLPAARAQDSSWIRPPASGVGNWNDGVNWSTGGNPIPPGPSNTARLDNGGSILVTDAASAQRFLFGQAGGQAGTGTMTIVDGGSLAADGNTNQFGANIDSDISLIMTGGQFNYTATGLTDFGRFGTAQLDISGGEFSVGGTLRLGVFNRDGHGRIVQSGGTISVGGNLSIMHGAFNATPPTRDPLGEVLQTGGTMNVADTTFIGFSGATTGTALYEIGPGTLNTSTLTISGSEQATLRVTDPTAEINVGSRLNLENNAAIESVSGASIRFTQSTGSLVADSDSPYFTENVYVLNSLNLADTSAVAGLANITLVFAGGELNGASMGLFEVAGTDMGPIPAGFVDNFSLGGLSIGEESSIGNLKLSDLLLNGAADATPQALYVDHLSVTAGSTLDLNGLSLYYKTAAIEGAVLNGTPLQMIPEPSICTMLGLAGVIGLLWRRRVVPAKLVPIAVLAVAFSSQGASAQDAFWARAPEQGVGNWNDSANWTISGSPGIPGPSNTARLDNGGSILVDDVAVALRLLFGQAGSVGGTGTMTIVEGGTLTAAGNTNQFGANIDSDITLVMTGGQFNYTATGLTDIARFGTALLDMSGGEFSVGGTLRLGVFNRDGRGKITQSGGTINVGNNLSIMHGAFNATPATRAPAGEIIQTGGELNVTGTTYLGFPGADTGTALYEIGPGKLSTEVFTTGGSTEATFRITDPSADITVRSHLNLAGNTVFEAVSGARIKFTDPSGNLIGDPENPFFAENVYFTNFLDVANSSLVSGLNNTEFVFAGGSLGGANPGLFEVGGTDLGPVLAGFVDNFALGAVTIGDGTTIGNLKLADFVLNGAEDDTPQALYVDQLTVTSGSTLDLSGLNLYYKGGAIDGTILGGSPTLVDVSALPGDFDGDGVVDGVDFLLWQRGESPNPLSQSDLEEWEANFGKVPQAITVVAVPEPASYFLLIAAALLVVGSARHTQRCRQHTI